MKNSFVLSKLMRDDVAQQLTDNGMEPMKAHAFALKITDDEMQILADETWEAIMATDAFWLALDYAVSENLDIPVTDFEEGVSDDEEA
jgi:hypothetical protein